MGTTEVVAPAEAADEAQEEVGEAVDQMAGLGREEGAEEAPMTRIMAEALVVAGVVVAVAGQGRDEGAHHLRHHPPGPLLPRKTYSMKTSSLVSPLFALRRSSSNFSEFR